MAPSPSSVTVEQLERTDDYVVAVWRELMLLVWFGDASAIGVERSRALFDQWTAQHGRGMALLVVILSQRPLPPDDATREAMQRVTATISPKFKGMATLLESEGGFIAAAVRAVMIRVRGVPSVFKSSRQAAEWAAAALNDPEITPAGLAQAISVARVGDGGHDH